MEHATSILSCQASLGECPVWVAAEQRLYFLDILAKRLHRFDPVTGADETFPLKTLTGCIAPLGNGHFLLSAQTGIQEVRLGNQNIEVLRTLTHPEADGIGNRYNDGKISPEGRFWFGSLNMNHEQNKASLYCWDGKECRKVLTPATNSNGLAWSPDGNTFYWIDTPTRKVEAFDYDQRDGNLSNRRTAVRFPDDLSWGRPDGMTVDAAGHLWLAHWSGGIITQWHPQTGECLRTVHLPVSNVSSLTFGGDHSDTLFITTARSANETESGNLFAYKP
jgi:sugar lactone lactonase YvrE